jgi:hypothetical protein
MSENDLDIGTTRFLAALERPPLPLEAYRSGDPQKPGIYEAITREFVHGNLAAADVLIDFGCGSEGRTIGVLQEICGAQPPRYIAVDIKPMLDTLAIPTDMHSNSEKIEAAKFSKGDRSEVTRRASMVIIQNVLHELDIPTTAALLHHLRNHLRPTADIYIQDMETLPEAEKRNVPWDPTLLEELLTTIGFKVRLLSDTSKSGTRWFQGNAVRIGEGPLSLETVMKECIAARQKQLDQILAAADLATLSDAPTSTLNISRVSLDHVQLTLQLQRCGAARPPTGQDTTRTDRRFEDRFDYAVQPDALTTERTGLAEILARKDVIEFPSLYRSAKEKLCMAGYSQRSMFSHKENIPALLDAVRKGVTIRIMLSAPDSVATTLRGSEPAYTSVDALRAEIYETIHAAAEFRSRIEAEIGTRASDLFELRLTQRGIPASYFIVDDRCYVSLYSSRITGSNGPCLVFRRVDGVPRNYYLLLADEFSDAFATAKPFRSDGVV